MFAIVWTETASMTYAQLRAKAEASVAERLRSTKNKATRDEGLFKQVYKCIEHLRSNPRHPALHTHVYHSLPNPYKSHDKVFEAYIQNRTPGAYRLFWCYGPENAQITIIAITPHP